MTESRFAIFLSGTRRDLAEFYEPAKAALLQAFPECVVQMMEDAEPEDIPGAHWSRSGATRPDVLVGLIGDYYGAVLSGDSRSLTEQEFDVAGQVGIERLMFRTTASKASALADQADLARTRVASFQAKIDGSVFRRSVATPEEFSEHVVAAVREWESRTLRGATQTADVYFAPLLQSAPLFSHTETLVGQADALGRLNAFAASTKRILLLHAPWGRGKSRVLLEFARSAAVPVRFLRPDGPVTRTQLNVSAADPLVIVLEEPLLRAPEELRFLLAFLHRCDPRVKLLVAARSSALDALEALIRGVGVPANDVEALELQALNDGEQRQLVTQVLGADGSMPYQLALRTRGSPLAAVLAARLIRRGDVTFGDLDGNPDFVGEVFGRFKDALLTTPGLDVTAREQLQALLHVLSLCAPVRPSDDQQRDALARFLGRAPEEVSRGLETLEDLGLLVRRGGLVTIPVEGIREAEALGACLTRRGELTGLAERALRELNGVFLGHLLQTLARVEWRAGQSGQTVSILERVWPELEALYDAAPASVRLRLLKDLEGVAPYQPRRTIRFVRHAQPSGVGPEETEELLRTWGPLEVIRVYDGLTALLRHVLYDPACVVDACDLLHRMAQGDSRTPPQHPECAKRGLLDLAKFDPFRQVPCYEAFLGWAESRLQDGSIPGAQVAEYVRPLLAKEMEGGYSDEQAMHFWSEVLSVERVRPLHDRVLAILKRLAADPDRLTSAIAIQAIGDALDPPLGGWNRDIKDAELAAWAPEQLSAISDLREIARARQDRVVYVCVLQAVSSAARFAERAEVKGAATELEAELLGRLDRTPELVLLRFWVAPWGPDEDSDRRHLEATDDVADALISSGRPPGQLARDLADTFDAMNAAGLDPDVARLSGALARRDVRIGEAFVQVVSDASDPEIAECAGAALHVILEQDRARGVAKLDQAITRGGVHLKRAVARAYKHDAFRALVGAAPGLDHLRALLRDSDVIVRVESVSALWLAKEWSPAERVTMLLAYDSSSEGRRSIDRWAMAVEQLFEALTTPQLEELADSLKGLRAIDYHAEGILLRLGQPRPDLVVDVLLARVERADQRREEYEAIPFRVQRDFISPLPADVRRRGLFRLGAYLRLRGQFRVQHAAQQLFARLGGGDSGIKRAVRLEWASSGDSALVLCAAQSFRDESPEVLFTEEASVAAILGAATRLGADVFQSAQSEMLCASANGVRTGTPGQPMPQDVAIRDQARAVAARYDRGSVEAEFYEAIVRQAEASIEHHLRIHEENSLE